LYNSSVPFLAYYSNFNELNLGFHYLNKIFSFCSEKNINLYTYNLIKRIYYVNDILDFDFGENIYDYKEKIIVGYSNAKSISKIDLIIIMHAFEHEGMKPVNVKLTRAILTNQNGTRLTSLLKIFDCLLISNCNNKDS